MSYYKDPAKNTFAYNLAVAKEMAAAESFPTKQAKKDCLTRIQRAYECLVEEVNRAALRAIGHHHWNVYPRELRHIHEDKHLKLLHAGLGWDKANSVTYLKGYQTQVKEMPVVKPAAKPKAPARTTERQATHVGTCQICGRMHKVDVKTGRIASHGYTKQFGGHFNSCFGSNHMPYETHTDRLHWYAKMVHEHLLDCVIARDEAAEAGDKEQYKKQQYMAERCSNLLTNIQQRIDEHKPDQPLTPVEELV